MKRVKVIVQMSLERVFHTFYDVSIAVCSTPCGKLINVFLCCFGKLRQLLHRVETVLEKLIFNLSYISNYLLHLVETVLEKLIFNLPYISN